MSDGGIHEIARRKNVGLYHMVIGRGAFRAVAGDEIIGSNRRAHALHGAHGENERIVARCGDGAVSAAAVDAESSIVAGCCYDHNPGLPGCLHRLTQRIVGVIVPDGASEGQVDDADVVSALQSDSLLDGRNDVAVAPATVRAKHAQVDEIHVRRHPSILPVGKLPVASKNACHVGSVAVGVIDEIAGSISVAGAGKVLVIEHSRGCSRALREVRVSVVDTAVDNGHGHAGAVVAGLKRHIGADRGIGKIVCRLEVVIGANGTHLSSRSHCRQNTHRHGKCRGSNKIQAPMETASKSLHAGNVLVSGSLSKLDDDPYHWDRRWFG